MRLVYFLGLLLIACPAFAQDDVEVTAYPQRKSEFGFYSITLHSALSRIIFIWPVIKRLSLDFGVAVEGVGTSNRITQLHGFR